MLRRLWHHHRRPQRSLPPDPHSSPSWWPSRGAAVGGRCCPWRPRRRPGSSARWCSGCSGSSRRRCSGNCWQIQLPLLHHLHLLLCRRCRHLLTRRWPLDCCCSSLGLDWIRKQQQRTTEHKSKQTEQKTKKFQQKKRCRDFFSSVIEPNGKQMEG